MKITFDIDCTPQEARAVLGLPDLEPLQEELVKELQRQLERNVSLMDPEALLKNWLPTTLQGFEDLRKLFGGALSAASTPRGTATSKPASESAGTKRAATKGKKRRST